MEKWSLKALADGLLRRSLGGSSRYGIRTVNSGHPGPLGEAVIALCRDQRLDEHYNAGEATLQVLRGWVRVNAGGDVTDGVAGELLIVPAGQHTVTAVEDSVVLLAVARRASPRDAAPAHAAMSPREYGVDVAPTTFDRETNP